MNLSEQLSFELGESLNDIETLPKERIKKVVMEAKDLMGYLKQAENNIKQLVDMASGYAKDLGLGKKVREEDFIEPIKKAMKLAK